jgi:hypothetical protein
MDNKLECLQLPNTHSKVQNLRVNLEPVIHSVVFSYPYPQILGYDESALKHRTI